MIRMLVSDSSTESLRSAGIELRCNASIACDERTEVRDMNLGSFPWGDGGCLRRKRPDGPRHQFAKARERRQTG